MSQNENNENNENRCGNDGGEGREVGSGGERILSINIIGQIEGHYLLDSNQKATKYENLIPALIQAEEDKEIDGVLFAINTMGGDVEAGLAIAEMISSMSKPTVSLVLGGGHSIGIPLAVAPKKSFIVPSATMTIHPVRTTGMVIGVPQTFYYFNKMQERILDFIVKNSKADREQLLKMMMNTDELANDVGTIIEGEDAVGCGLIDELGGVSKALEALKGMIGQGK